MAYQTGGPLPNVTSQLTPSSPAFVGVKGNREKQHVTPLPELFIWQLAKGELALTFIFGGVGWGWDKLDNLDYCL